MAVLVVVGGEEHLLKARAPGRDPNWPGKAGQYLSVLNCASLKGLSFETCGREWLWLMCRSESSPLGMDSTGLVVSEQLRAGLATGYTLRRRGLRPVTPREVPSPA